MECEEYKSRRVKLGYVADCGTCVQLVDSIGNQVFDMLPVIQAGETDTSIELIAPTRRIRYYPEEYTRTEGKSGCYYDICIPDIEALMLLNEIGNVESVAPANGETIVYNSTTQQYEMFDLAGALADINTAIASINTRIDNLDARVTQINNTLTQQITRINNLYELCTQLDNKITAVSNRVSSIENAIYNWGNDKSTKIPRATINVTSGGPNSNWIIQSRAKNQDNDLDFQ